MLELRERVTRPTILLADDHPVILANLCRLTETVGEVVSAVSDGRAAVEESLRLHPDVVVLDIMMPERDGITTARLLCQRLPKCKIVMCSMYTNAQLIAEAFSAGAVGFVRKQSAHSDLPPAIKAALAGETFVSPSLLRNTTPLTKNGGSR